MHYHSANHHSVIDTKVGSNVIDRQLQGVKDPMKEQNTWTIALDLLLQTLKNEFHFMIRDLKDMLRGILRLPSQLSAMDSGKCAPGMN